MYIYIIKKNHESYKFKIMFYLVLKVIHNINILWNMVWSLQTFTIIKNV